MDKKYKVHMHNSTGEKKHEIGKEMDETEKKIKWVW